MKNTIKNLQKNGFKIIKVKNRQEALAQAKTFFTNVTTIGLGGSETVNQIGLIDWMTQNSNLSILNQYEPNISMAENVERRRKGMLVDIYVTGTNAITESGYLINVDGSGNRVAAQIYGPKKVLLIVGKNKIVKNIEAGFERVERMATPKNLKRLEQKALAHGKQSKYTADNIQNIFCVIKKSNEKERINIILVDEELGY